MHPSTTSLERFMSGDLSPIENRDIVRHLVAGCSSCTEETTRLWDVVITGRSAPVPPPEAYERAFDRAREKAAATYSQLLREKDAAAARCLELLRLAPQQQQMLVRNNPSFQTLSLCDAVLTSLEDTLFDDAAAAVNLANVAQQIAEHLEVSVYGAANIADAKARASTLAARAFRETSDYEAAERALRTARAHLDEGTGDPTEKAKFLSSLGSLLTARRRSHEALKVYDELETLHSKLGDRHMVGRVQLKKAFTHAKLQEPEAVIELLHRSIELLDPARDPRRQTIALHNLVLALVESGRPEEAKQHIDELRRLHTEQGGHLNQVRFRWLEGRLAYALGESNTAEDCFATARTEFIELEIGIDVALASLDLAQVLFDRGDLDQAQERLTEAIPILQALGVQPEARAALAFLGQALQVRAAGAKLIRRTAAFVRRVQVDPSARFRPEEILSADSDATV